MSTRVSVDTGDGAVISGFIVSGGAQTVVVRALGPSLTRYGVAGALADPVLELHDSAGTVIATNDDWTTTGTAFKQAGPYRQFQPLTPQEPALAVTLQPGSYTAVVHGKNGGTGVALAEVYAVSETAGATVSNMSSRALVRTGDNVLIGGLTISGDTAVPIILRATGPSLSRYGVTNALANPILELHDSSGNLIGYSDNWRDDADQAARITRAGYAPTITLEPALSVTLAPGTYTAIVRGSGNSSGVALLEAYQVAGTQSAASSPTPAPTPAPPTTLALPRGVFSLVEAGNKIDPSTLTNPLVDGISLRQAWSALQPSPGVYDWSYFDAQIASAAAAGKQVSIRVGTGADNIPAWVMTAVRGAGGNTFTFSDGEGRHIIPVFWDPTFLWARQAMITALGARYTNNPAVKVFSTSFANSSSNDWSVPHNSVVDSGYAIDEILRWENAGYSSQKLIDAGNAIINTSMKAFPNQLISLPINPNGGLDSPKGGNYVAQTVIANARSIWGATRLIVTKNSLSATTAPAPSAAGTSTALWYNSRPAVAGQALWYSYGDPTYANNGGTPCAPATSLQRLIQLGATYGLSYIEIYETDVINLPSAIAYAHAVL